jgi:hypothetical protein
MVRYRLRTSGFEEIISIFTFIIGFEEILKMLVDLGRWFRSWL